MGGFSKPRTAAIQSLDSVPLFRIMCYVPLMALVPSLSPLQDSPARAPCLHTICSRVHLSLLLLPPLRPFFVYLSSPPVAQVVTRRPLELTGGRCHAAPGVLSSVPMFEVLPPPNLCGWWYLARVWVEGRRRRCPSDDLDIFNASYHTSQINRSIFGALDSPQSSWCSSLSAPPQMV